MHSTLRALRAFLGERWEEEAPPWMQPGKGVYCVLIPRLTPERVALLHDLHAPHAVLGHAMAPLHSAVGDAWRRMYIMSCCTAQTWTI